MYNMYSNNNVLFKKNSLVKVKQLLSHSVFQELSLFFLLLYVNVCIHKYFYTLIFYLLSIFNPVLNWQIIYLLIIIDQRVIVWSQHWANCDYHFIIEQP